MMHDYIHTLQEVKIASTPEAMAALESGKVLYLPAYPFTLLQPEQALLSETILQPKRKNISYRYTSQQLSGCIPVQGEDIVSLMQHAIHRYAQFARHLVDTMLPSYQNALIWGRTSYRPKEIKGRPTSKRQDDTRLHVDSFAATPVNGLRILRVFSNVNPFYKPRVWHLGEPFKQVLSQFAQKLPLYNPRKAQILAWLKMTKSRRTAYDHYMLHLHDSMKLANEYQQNVEKYRMEFPAHSTWIVFTDQVSHAALSGQFLFEQTFYLPVEAMGDASLSPLRQLQMQWPQQQLII